MTVADTFYVRGFLGASVVGVLVSLVGCAAGDDSTIGAVSIKSSALSTSFSPYLTIPAYFDADSSFDTQWSLITNTSGYSIDSVGGYVIVNEDSGPGTTFDQDLANRIAAVQGVGWTVLGYVDDTYDRPVNDINNDIVAWSSYSVNGIFFDNAERDSTQYDIGKSQYLVVLTEQETGGYNAIFNWGTTPREHYVNCVGLFFNLAPPMVRFGSWEVDECNYLGQQNCIHTTQQWSPPAWLNDYRADHFIHIIHDADPTGSSVSTIASLAQSRNASSVYVTHLRENCDATTPCNIPGSTCNAANRCVDSSQNYANDYGDMPASALWNAENSTFNPSNTTMTFPSSDTDPARFSDCPGYAVACSHDVCGQGSPLAIDCDSSWNDCTRTVCAGDGYCCSTYWDGICVNEALTECSGVTCPAD